MVTRSIETDMDYQSLIRLMDRFPRPFTVSITQGKKRSSDQNSLQHVCYAEAAKQLPGTTADEWRAFFKLTVGVPILRSEDEAFRELYDKTVRPLPYEHKLACMVEPFDLPVTRQMTKDQMNQYLETIQRRLSEQGIIVEAGELYA